MSVKINTRTIVFIVLTAVTCLFSLLFCVWVWELSFPVTSISDNVGEVNIDGADITWLAELGAAAFEGIMMFVVGAVFFLLVTVGNCVSFLVMRLASVRKTSVVTADEINLCQIVLFGASGTFFLLTQILTRFQIAWYVGMLFWQIPVFGYLFQIWGLKRNMSGELKTDIPISFI